MRLSRVRSRAGRFESSLVTRGTPTRFTGRILNFALIGSLSSPYTFAALSGNPSQAKRNAGEREGEILTFSLSKICHKNPRSNSSNTRESVSFDFQSRSIFFYKHMHLISKFQNIKQHRYVHLTRLLV